MNEPIMNIDDLISHYIDGELSGEAEAELHHRLSVSPDDRRRFREQIVLRGVAGDRRMLERPTPAMRSALFARLEKDEGMSAVAATAGALAAEAHPSIAITESASSPSARPFAADRPASARRDDRARRRRLVPFLLPFLIGVILTGTIWQFSGRDDDSRAMAVSEPPGETSGGQSATAPPTAPFAQRGATDAGAAGAAGAASADGGTAEAGSSTASGAVGGATEGRASAAASSDADGAGTTASSYGASATDRSLAASQSDEGGIAASDPEAAERPRRDARRNSVASDRGEAAPEPLAIASAPARESSPMSDDMSALDGDGGGAREREEAAESSSGEGARSFGPRMMSVAPPPAQVEEPLSISAKRSTIRPSPTTISMTDGAGNTAALEAERDSLRSAVSLSSIMGGGAGSPIRIHGASPIDLEPARRSPVFMTGLRQSMIVGMREREARPELALRFGGEFGGAHAVYGVVGYTTFRESRVRTTNEFRYDAGIPATEYLYRTEQSQVAENQGELWAGAGYRINVIRGERWQAGAGAWGGYGQRYARAGAELPVTYVVSRNVRIELTPSVQYVSAHGSSVTDASTVTTAGATERSVVAEQTEVTDAELRAGIGLGVTVMME